MTSKTQATRDKQNVSHQNKKLLYLKRYKKVKRRSTEWKKIFTKYKFCKRLVSRIKNSLKFYNLKKFKMDKEL